MRRAVIVLCVVACSLSVRAQEEKPAEMTEEQMMMEQWMKAATPGKPHEGLSKMAGTWNVSVKMWMEPGAEALTSEGTAERAMILGGRVLAETFHGKFMGMDFEGHGMTGYDNQTDTWWGTWNDTLSTSLMLSKGQCTASMDMCTFMSEGKDPMSGQMMYMKSVFKRKGADKEMFESYVIGPDGEEMKMMELTYTRQK